MDVSSEVSFKITITEKKLRLITKALGCLARPEIIKPREGEAEAAWHLNKELLEMRKQAFIEQMKSVEDALRKIEEIEKQEEQEEQGKQSASMH